MSSDEENNTPQWLVCNKEFDSKPWLIVYCDKNYHYGCSYLCSRNFKGILGPNYWDGLINKEDFQEPRPVFGFTQRSNSKDITTGFGMYEIRQEIEDENLRIERIEEEYENESSEDGFSDEDIY